MDMQNTSGLTEEEKGSNRIYPTKWVPVNVLAPIDDVIECRQVSDDTFQLRSVSHEITINKAGFDVYRGGTTMEWANWLKDNNIRPVPRTDLDAES